MATTISNSGLDARNEDAPPRTRGGGARRVLQTIALAVLMLALGYLGGRLHGFFQASEAESEHAAALEEQRRAAAEQQTEHRAVLTQALDQTALARDQRDQLARLNTLYESYRQTQLALLGLDARNFGIAQTHLREGERLLLSLQSKVPELAPLLQRMASTDVAVAGNLAEQRRAIAAIAAELDALLAPRAAAMVSAGVTAGSADTDATSHADPAPPAAEPPSDGLAQGADDGSERQPAAPAGP